MVAPAAGDHAADDRDDLLESLETQVAVLARRARRVIALRAAMIHPELLPTSYVMLKLIAERGPLRASQVVEIFSLDKGAVSRQTQHLVDIGLLARSADPADRRASILSLTPDAVRRLDELRVKRRARLRSRLDDWDDADLISFVGQLDRYNSALAWIDEAEMPPHSMDPNC